MKYSIFLLCLFLVTIGVKSEKENTVSKDKSEVEQLQAEPSKISELYIGDLLRTNNKEALDTASTNHYQVASTPTYINSDAVSGHRLVTKNHAEHPRHELLPPLALNGQIGMVKHTKRADGVPVNLFEKFLVKQADLLDQNVRASERSPPVSSRRYTHSNGPAHQHKTDCDKHPHHSASTDDHEYARHTQSPHHTRDRTAAVSADEIPSRHRPAVYRQNSEHYSHSDPVYSKSRTHASDHDSDSDSSSKTVGSKSFSKSFSTSKTTTPNRVRQKAVILRDPEPSHQKYNTPYESDNRGHDSAYNDHSSDAPSSYEAEPPAQYESYTPAPERGRYYQDYSPQAYSKAPIQEHTRQPVRPKKLRAYKPDSSSSSHYRQQHSYGENQPPPCKDKYHCPSEYSQPVEYQAEYTQEKPKLNYDREPSIAPHKLHKYRETVKPDQSHYRVENENRHLNYEPYHPEENQPSSHKYPAAGYERNHHARRPVGEKRRNYSYRPEHPQERHAVLPEEQARYPEATQTRSNYEQKSNVDRMSQAPEPLEQYDSHIVTNRAVKPQISMSVSYSNSGYAKPYKNQKSVNLRSSRRSTSEVPAVEESRIDSQQPEAAQSSTSKSVSYSESRSYNADGRIPSHSQHHLNKHQARTYAEPQKMTNPLASKSSNGESITSEYPKVYKPLNSEYPATYANEQRHHPLHNAEGNIGRNSYISGREPRGDHSDSYEEDDVSTPIKTKSTHEYKSDITGYKDEYGSHEPLELDDAFFQKYGISKSAKIIVATAEKPNLFVADGTHLKEGQSNTDHENRPYESEEHGPYEHNSGESHDPNSGTPYEHSSGPSHSSEAPYGYNSEEEGNIKDGSVPYQKPEEINPFGQIPDSFDSLVHSNPSFLRNLNPLPNKFQNDHDLNLGGMFRGNVGGSKSFVNSNGQRELFQKHGDGVSRIVFNRQNQQFDESRKIENYQLLEKDKKEQLQAEKSEKIEIVAKVDDTKKTV